MSDVAEAPPVFSPDGTMQGNQTSGQGQPPAAPLAQPSPLAMGAPPAPTPPPPKQTINAPPMPQMGEQQRSQPAPDAKDYQKGAMEFASAMAVLGAVAGRFTRAPGGAALAAFAGALKGWQSGNLEAYETAAKKWEQDTKTTVENNRQVLEKYKLALENRKSNIDEQMANIQLISAQYHDQIMYDAATSKNYTMVAQIYEKNHEFTQKVSDSAAKLQEKRDEQKTKNEQNATYWLSPDGQTKLATLPPSQQAAVKQLIDIYGQKNAKPQNAAMERFMQENPNATAQEIQNFQSGSKPPRSAPAMALRKFMDEHPDATADDIKKFSGEFAGANSYGRTAGSTGARVENATNEVEQLLPQALETSRALPRGKFVPVNTLIQKWQQGTSDPAYNDFALSNFSLVNAYTRAMNPQGVPRIAERLEQHAVGILSTATSPEAYEVQARRLWKEVQASKTAVAKTAEGRTAGDINAPMPGDSRTAAPAGDDGWTVKEK